MNLTFRMAARGDEEKIAVFHQEARRVASKSEFWGWKYFDNPAGVCCMAIALEDDRIVGRLGFVPVKFRIDNKYVIAAHQVDSDILANYRMDGTYFKMSRILMEEGERRKLSFGFGFANKTTKEISIRSLGFSLVGPIGRLVKLIDPFHYIAKRFKTPLIGSIGDNIRKVIWQEDSRFSIGNINFYEIFHFDSRFDDLWEKISLGKIMVSRDSQYLNWRYFQCPTIKYRVWAAEEKGELKGFIVFHTLDRMSTRYGIIADLICNPDITEIMNGLLLAAKRCLSKHGSASIVCWLPKQHYFYSFLKNWGFRERQAPHYLVVKPNKNEDIPIMLLKEERNWFYMLGDSDYHLNPINSGKKESV